MKFLAFSQTKLGSSFDIARARVGGASVIPFLSSLLFSVPPSRRKVLGAKPPPSLKLWRAGKQAGKKEGGLGEGPEGKPLASDGVKIFARIGGFAQKMFELRSKNTAKFYIQRN